VERILLVTAEPWARNALALLRQCLDDVEVTHAIDGAQGLYYMCRSIAEGSPYGLLVLTTPLARIGAEQVVASLRAIERGLNRPPYPCLLCTPAAAPEGLLATYPQTLHLQIPESAEAAPMVAAAALQVLGQLRRFQEEVEV
jgi:hypothetical protein